jgi:hypothetical protein
VERKLQLWESLDLPAELERILDQIRPSVYEDTRRGYPYQEFERAVEEVRRFLRRRGRIVRLQLAGARTSRVTSRAGPRRETPIRGGVG